MIPNRTLSLITLVLSVLSLGTSPSSAELLRLTMTGNLSADSAYNTVEFGEITPFTFAVDFDSSTGSYYGTPLTKGTFQVTNASFSLGANTYVATSVETILLGKPGNDFHPNYYWFAIISGWSEVAALYESVSEDWSFESPISLVTVGENFSSAYNSNYFGEVFRVGDGEGLKVKTFEGSVTATVTAVPEPSTLIGVIVGGSLLIGQWYRRRR